MTDFTILQKEVKAYQNFPLQNLTYYDIFPLFSNINLRKSLFDTIRNKLTQYFNTNNKEINMIIGLETEGFLIGTVLADQLKLPFLPIRKGHKLPGNILAKPLINGNNIIYNIEIQSDYVNNNFHVLLVDGKLGNGTKLKTAEDLVELAGGKVIAKLVIIEESSLNGRQMFNDPDSVISILKY
jgi:adenine phosphoribosyltransferase